jgi:hypothetical protein
MTTMSICETIGQLSWNITGQQSQALGRRRVSRPPRMRSVGLLLLAMAMLCSVPAMAQRPEAVIAPSQQILNSMGDPAVLDATGSTVGTGTSLSYSWREDPNNPALGLLPANADSIDTVTLYFPKPGHYEFRLRVSDGVQSGGNAFDNEDAVAAVDVPGIVGSTYALPSDGSIKVPGTHLLVYSHMEAAEQGIQNMDNPPVTIASGPDGVENHCWWVDHPDFGGRCFDGPLRAPDPLDDDEDNQAVIDAYEAALEEFEEWGGHPADYRFWYNVFPAIDWRPEMVTGMYLVTGGLHPYQITNSGWGGMEVSASINSHPGDGQWWVVTNTGHDFRRSLMGTIPLDVAVSDSEGNYSLENLPFSTDEITMAWVREPDYVGSNTEELVLNPANVERDWGIARPSESEVSGLVQERTTSAPITEVNVSIIAGSNVMVSDSTDENGIFELHEVNQGAWMVQLWKPGYRSELRSIQIYANMNDPKFSMVTDNRIANMSGQITIAETNEPIGGARVVLGGSLSVETDLGGFFRFVGLPVGRYVAHVEHDSFETQRVLDLIVEPGENVQNLTMNFSGAGPALTGIVTWSDGTTPAAGVQVGLVDTSLLQTGAPYVLIRSAVTDAGGSYLLQDCPVGAQTLVASGHAIVGGNAALTIISNQETDLALTTAAPAAPPTRFAVSLTPNAATLNNLGETVSLSLSMDGVGTQANANHFYMLDSDNDGVLTLAETGALPGTEYGLALGLDANFAIRDADDNGSLVLGEAQASRPSGGEFALLGPNSDYELTLPTLNAFPPAGFDLVVLERLLRSLYDDTASTTSAGPYVNFVALDLDGNSELSEAEIAVPGRPTLLDVADMDEDGDGLLTVAELQNFVVTGGVTQNGLLAEMYEQNLGTFDTGGGAGTLDITEMQYPGTTMLQAAFDALDADVNNSLSPAEVAADGRIAVKFNFIDSDADGGLSLVEINAAVPSQALFDRWDAIGVPDGEVSAEEIQSRGGLTTVALDLATRFGALDTDADGFLSYFEATPLRPTPAEYIQFNYDTADGITIVELQDLIRSLSMPDLEAVRDDLVIDFYTLDVSANGGLSMAEAQVPGRPTLQEFDVMDLDNNSTITQGELQTFINLYQSGELATLSAILNGSFDAFDTGTPGDGTLDLAEAMQVRPTQDEYDAMNAASPGDDLTLADLTAYLAALPGINAETDQRASELAIGWGAADWDESGDLTIAEARDAPNRLSHISWQESPQNPVLGLLPGSASSSLDLTLSFPKPGTYVFSVQAVRGALLSSIETVQVFVPGISGRVVALPSDGLTVMPNVAVRAYNDYQSALMWNENVNATGSTYSDSRGYFTFETLPQGKYWVAAKDLSGNPFVWELGEVSYGPASRASNASKHHTPMEVGLRLQTFQIQGAVYLGAVGAGNVLESARVIVSPSAISEAFTTTTDRDGRYVLEGVPAGSHNFMVIADDYMTNAVGELIPAQAITKRMDIAEDGTVNFILPEEDLALTSQKANLSGFVMASVAGFQPMPVSYAEIIVAGGYKKAYTDANGYYSIQDLPAGVYAGIVRKNGYEPQNLSTSGVLALLPGENTQNYLMTTQQNDKSLPAAQHGPVVYGKVTDGTGIPVADTLIEVLRPAFGPWAVDGVAAVSTLSDQAGNYMLPELPQGRHIVRVTFPVASGLTSGVFVSNLVSDLRVPVFPGMLGADADFDGIMDAIEGVATDTDGDGDFNSVDTDSDGDGILDSIEGLTDTDGDGTANYLDTDSDGDGILDIDEGQEDADGDWVPNFMDLDSDNDTLSDFVENSIPGLNPYDANGENGASGDMDGDGLTNAEEINGTPPTRADLADTDADGLTDYDEIYVHRSNPGVLDENVDGLPDGWDTDMDGMPDGWEVDNGLSPTDDGTEDLLLDTNGDGDFTNDNDGNLSEGPDGDPDGDGFTNLEEYTYRMGVVVKQVIDDADGDSLLDADEATLGTDPNNPDTDGDGLPDGWEHDRGLDPLDDGSTDIDNGPDGDIDGDGVSNLEDYLLTYGDIGLDPVSLDSDGDGMNDDWEIDAGLDPTDPTGDNGGSGDLDGDGLSNVDEFTNDTDPNSTDTDGDGLLDNWEVVNGLDPLDGGAGSADEGASGDPDGDGLTNIAESAAGTDPLDADTDGDGLSDGDEVNRAAGATDPTDPDSDGDGLSDGWEVDNGYDPLVNVPGEGGSDDPDADGLTNLEEASIGTDPANADSDGDGLNDGEEYGTAAVTGTGTDPANADSDGDGLGDGWEVDNGLDPLDDGTTDPDSGASGDPDGDGLSNESEFIAGSDPNDADSDDDGLTDGEEALHGTSPLSEDTDGDGLPDEWEVSNGLDAVDDGTVAPVNGADGDPDGDGISNADENTGGTNPLAVDTDGDAVSDGDEIASGTDPLDTDSDNDGVTDGAELTGGTDPLDSDSDDDGISDGTEITNGTDPLVAEVVGPVLAIDPLTRTVDSGQSVVSFTVINSNASDMGWSTTLEAGATFLSISSGSSAEASGMKFSVSYDANATAAARTATITVDAWDNVTGSAAANSPLTVTLEQLACDAPDAPVNVAVLGGTSALEVTLAWDAVEGASSYNVYRGTTDIAGDATLLASSVEATYVDTLDALVGDDGGCFGGGSEAVSQEFYYWVSAQNDCDESAVSAPVTFTQSAEKGLAPGRVYEKALPSLALDEDTRLAAPGSDLALRLRSKEGIDTETVWSSLSVDGAVIDGNAWLAAGAGEKLDDIWVVQYLSGDAALGSEVVLTVGAETISGAVVGPVSMTFLVEEDASPVILPELQDSLAPAQTIAPISPYDGATEVVLSLAGIDEGQTLQLYYLFDDGISATWYPAEAIDGWLVPDSLRIEDRDGEESLVFEVLHGAIVQVGVAQETVDEAAALPLPNSRYGAWLIFSLLAALLVGLRSRAKGMKA